MRMLFRQATLETKLLLRDKESLFWTLIFPLLFVVLFGLLYGDTVWEGMDIPAIAYVMPGILVMGLMVTGLMATAQTFALEREKGIYRRLSLTPLRPYAILGGQILNRYLWIMVQMLVLLLVGILAFSVPVRGHPLWIWLVITLGALCFMSIGFLLAGLIRSASAANGITMVVFFLLLFLGGVFFPVDMMPTFLSSFAQALPSTLINHALREVMVVGAGIGEVWSQLLGAVGWAVVSLFGAIKLFRWE